jgi:hypothetical protein
MIDGVAFKKNYFLSASQILTYNEKEWIEADGCDYKKQIYMLFVV